MTYATYKTMICCPLYIDTYKCVGGGWGGWVCVGVGVGVWVGRCDFGGEQEPIVRMVSASHDNV